MSAETLIPQRYQPTPEDRLWRLRRWGYYLLHLACFLLIATTIGPNLFLFHSPFSPGVDYYVASTKQYIPTIAAIKAYNRDFGHLPFGNMDLPPEYAPAHPPAGVG